MRIAALTYVYNESVNLPIWRRYYGSHLGEKNLYIVDRESNDGSTADLGNANKIVVPHIEFDDIRKSATLSSIHAALLQSFDVVIVTDCDEIVVADPEFYDNICQYIQDTKPVVANCVGLNIRHIITMEKPLDLKKSVLSQRKIASFERAGCKPLISSVPTVWEAGNHVCNKTPRFDKKLFNFHLKFVDYSIAMSRQDTNKETVWSSRAIEAGHGVHHRYEVDRFVAEGFLEPINWIRSGKVEPFDFTDEIQALTDGISESHGFFYPGQATRKYVEIPERFSDLL